MSITLPNYITGAYAVGTERFTVTDDSRQEVLGPKCGPRKLEVRLFYPVCKEMTEGKKRMKLSEERVHAIQKACMVKTLPEGLVRPECYTGVPQAEGKFPLVLYSHGYGSGVTEGNCLLCCELASNGYIVASIGHAYEAAICEFDDGTVALYDKEIKIQTGGHLKQMISVFTFPVKIRSDVICRYREGKNASLSIPLGHDFNVSAINHIHLKLTVAVSKGHFFTCNQRVLITQIFRTSPIKS